MKLRYSSSRGTDCFGCGFIVRGWYKTTPEMSNRLLCICQLKALHKKLRTGNAVRAGIVFCENLQVLQISQAMLIIYCPEGTRN